MLSIIPSHVLDEYYHISLFMNSLKIFVMIYNFKIYFSVLLRQNVKPVLKNAYKAPKIPYEYGILHKNVLYNIYSANLEVEKCFVHQFTHLKKNINFNIFQNLQYLYTS